MKEEYYFTRIMRESPKETGTQVLVAQANMMVQKWQSTFSTSGVSTRLQRGALEGQNILIVTSSKEGMKEPLHQSALVIGKPSVDDPSRAWEEFSSLNMFMVSLQAHMQGVARRLRELDMQALVEAAIPPQLAPL